jgi:hypothetical protein
LNIAHTCRLHAVSRKIIPVMLCHERPQSVDLIPEVTSGACSRWFLIVSLQPELDFELGSRSLPQHWTGLDSYFTKVRFEIRIQNRILTHAASSPINFGVGPSYFLLTLVVLSTSQSKAIDIGDSHPSILPKPVLLNLRRHTMNCTVDGHSTTNTTKESWRIPYYRSSILPKHVLLNLRRHTMNCRVDGHKYY